MLLKKIYCCRFALVPVTPTGKSFHKQQKKLWRGWPEKVSLAFFELEKPSLEDIVAKLHNEGETNIFIACPSS